MLSFFIFSNPWWSPDSEAAWVSGKRESDLKVPLYPSGTATNAAAVANCLCSIGSDFQESWLGLGGLWWLPVVCFVGVRRDETKIGHIASVLLCGHVSCIYTVSVRFVSFVFSNVGVRFPGNFPLPEAEEWHWPESDTVGENQRACMCHTLATSGQRQHQSVSPWNLRVVKTTAWF